LRHGDKHHRRGGSDPRSNPGRLRTTELHPIS
jgi:hypothetical protein